MRVCALSDGIFCDHQIHSIAGEKTEQPIVPFTENIHEVM